MKKLIVLGLLLAGSAFGNEDLPEFIKKYYFPEIDFKNVQFLPDNHLGKNKPRYGKFQWKMVESLRFRIYTYETSNELVDMYLTVAERTFKEFSDKFRFGSFSAKIAVVIYNSIQDFEETNLVPGLVPKGLGGLTEIQENRRVVVAFRGSVIGFQRLLRHELTHRYHVEILQLSTDGRIVGFPPLWFIEGAAEHYSHDWDVHGELVMRNAYLNNSLAPVTEPYWYSGALIYKQGKFVLDFLAERHKAKGEVISAILSACREMRFETAFQKVTGESLEEFQNAFNRYVENRYYQLRVKKDFTEDARPMNAGTILASRGQFFVTRKDSVTGRNLLVLNWTDGVNFVSETLVEDGRLRNVALRGFPLEVPPEFGFSDHGASFGPGNTVVYAVDVSGQDELRVQYFDFDSKEKKIRLGKTLKYAPEGIRYLQYPVFVSSDVVAFIGRLGVFSEIYLYNLITKNLQKLTSAKRNYRNLTYSKKLNVLVTSAENDKTSSYDLVYGDLARRSWHFLTETPENELSPEFSPDGEKLVYVSDKDLVYNLYLRDFEAKTLVPLSDARFGVFNPKWFTDKGLVFNGIAKNEIVAFITYVPTVQTASATLAESGVSSTAALDDPFDEFSALLPHIGTLTVIQKTISPDKKKALFAVNRALSFNKPKKKEDWIDFYLVELEDRSVTWYTLGLFKDCIDCFESVEFLAGTNFLVKARFLSGDGKNSSLFYYIFNWQQMKVYFLGEWNLRFLMGAWVNPNPIFQMSEGRSYLTFVKNKKLTVYDALEKKIVYERRFGKVLDAKLLDLGRLMVVEKLNWLEKEDLRVWSIDIFGNKSDNFLLDEEFVSWHFLPGNKKFFLVTRTKEKPHYFNIHLAESYSTGIGLVQADLPGIKNVQVKGETLVVETSNPLPMTLVIDANGKVTSEVKDLPVTPVSAVEVAKSGVAMKPYVFPADSFIQRKVSKPRKFPKIHRGYLGANSNLTTYVSLAASFIAFDALNDRIFYTDTFLTYNKSSEFFEGGLYGFADVNYWNLASGYSLGLDYLHRSNFKKIDVRFSQNIFLHELLNWDATLRRQHVRAVRYRGEWPYETEWIREWQRTYLGTTFSLDTITEDWHGPTSGNAVFTGVEVGLDDSGDYQSLDLNLDARHYWSFGERSGLAVRFAGGTSFGPNPTSFVWGGNKTFRGVPLFSQSGNSYFLQSTELRVPLFDFIRAKASSSIVDALLLPFTTTVDMRGGIYNDLGDMWNRSGFSGLFEERDHSGFNLQSSTGVFLNVPSIFGFTLRFSWAMAGKKHSSFWIGRNF